jgi:bifunctional non-homologous end joining protein LigD
MSLQEYKRKRDFEVTAEPEGHQKKGPDGHGFVIQKHAASRLHYDFRLEMEGVLKSWAVPKGPSYDPTDKRLAVHVEDHPVEYGTFEGIIPKGQYGGGTVMLWDHGHWEPLDNPHQGLRAGKLKFRMHGEKMHGVWNLVKTGKEENSWLLFKEKDEFSKSHDEFDVTTLDRSVTTGRTMDEIAANADTVWQSNRNEFETDLGKKAKMPGKFSPELATLVENIPEDDDWVHEIKYDGYRLQARIDEGKVRLITRGDQDWTSKFPAVARALLELPVRTAIVDGEVVVLNPDGTNNFQQLQNIMQGEGGGELIFYAFDLPFCQDRDLRDEPLHARKALLKELLEHAEDPVRFSAHIVGNGPIVLDNACKLGCEGVISKRMDSPYTGRRTHNWLKSKCLHEEEFVVVGFTKGEGSRLGFGSLVLAQWQDGELRHAGRVGTGFNGKMLKAMRTQLDELITDKSPLSHSLTRAESKGVTWVKPELVAQVGYGERTDSGILRHPRFHGQRLDKRAEDVRPERAVSTPVPGAVLKKMKLSSPERVIDPGTGLTKLDLAVYYESVGPRMLPHIEKRPLTVVRCPGGTSQQCFYQKHVKDGFPKSVKSVPVVEDDGIADYIMVDTLEGLLALVQMGGLEFHPWGSKADDLDRPDRLVFDLDPDTELGWEHVITATLDVRDQLAALGLQSWCKTTGGKGLHVCVPLQRKLNWEDTKAFCKAFAEMMARAAPKKYTSVMSKERRKGKIFLDYLRNGQGATSVSTYSARSRAGVPISVPLEWSEVTPALDPKAFTIKTWPERADLDAQLWTEFSKTRQSITKAMLKKVDTPGYRD